VRRETDDEADFKALTQAALQNFGRLNVAVNSGSQSVTSVLLDITWDTLDTVMCLNFFGPTFFSKYMAKEALANPVVGAAFSWEIELGRVGYLGELRQSDASTCRSFLCHGPKFASEWRKPAYGSGKTLNDRSPQQVERQYNRTLPFCSVDNHLLLRHYVISCSI
jgi:NAD(P)-dependent dehydrogenase (short-subunit alcohol dehydrogenase family)